MNSTATELEFTRRGAMRAIVKGFVVGTLGLAVLFGSYTISFAEPKGANAICRCTCTYRGDDGKTHRQITELAGNGLSCVINPPTNHCTGVESDGTLHADGKLSNCGDTGKRTNVSGASKITPQVGFTQVAPPSPGPAGVRPPVKSPFVPAQRARYAQVPAVTLNGHRRGSGPVGTTHKSGCQRRPRMVSRPKIGRAQV